MNWNDIDWQTLGRLRTAFLDGTAGRCDYWQTESDLASYDATFAQRIGWKWDYVLEELVLRGWSPPYGEILDWGCGSGIAGRAFLDRFGAESASRLQLWDRSSLAMSYAAKRAREKYPGLAVSIGEGNSAICPHPGPLPRGEGESFPVGRRIGFGRNFDEASATAPASGRKGESDQILLLSHVLTELTPEQTDSLAGLAARTAAVLWVEPGTYQASLTLIAVRERLREQLQVIAPCTHINRCGILAPANDRHWCHHFASPPPAVFQDGHWARFAKTVGVDLRDLSLSFLVLDRRPASPLPPGATRIIGHPRVYKPHALLLGCDDAGVRERKLTRRALPEEFRRLKKGDGEVLQVWRCNGEEIVETRGLFPAAKPGPRQGDG